nr:MAG TPA: hypothetical protein [Caudoviricetes sp.]
MKSQIKGGLFSRTIHLVGHSLSRKQPFLNTNTSQFNEPDTSQGWDMG